MIINSDIVIKCSVKSLRRSVSDPVHNPVPLFRDSLRRNDKTPSFIHALTNDPSASKMRSHYLLYGEERKYVD